MHDNDPLWRLRHALAASDEDAARVVIHRWVEGYSQGEAGRRTSS